MGFLTFEKKRLGVFSWYILSRRVFVSLLVLHIPCFFVLSLSYNFPSTHTTRLFPNRTPRGIHYINTSVLARTEHPALSTVYVTFHGIRVPGKCFIIDVILVPLGHIRMWRVRLSWDSRVTCSRVS